MSFINEQGTSTDTIAESSLDELVAKYFGPNLPPMKVEFGALSHRGNIRTNNEDHYGVIRRYRSREVLLTNLPDGFLPPSEDVCYVLAVADGIGGAAYGELASMLALRTGWDLTGSAFKWHFKMTDQEFLELQEMVKVYGQLIHRNLVARAQADPQLAGMGTTITAALTIGRDALIAHVGDSRAYRFRDGSLELLTRDHTMAQQMVDAGVIPSISHASRLMRSMLVNCLGGRNRGEVEVEVDVRRVQLNDGDRLLLCTDGLTDMLIDTEIEHVLDSYPVPQDACQVLVNRALDRGGKDNVTVVLARFAVADAEKSTSSDRQGSGGLSR